MEAEDEKPERDPESVLRLSHPLGDDVEKGTGQGKTNEGTSTAERTL